MPHSNYYAAFVYGYIDGRYAQQPQPLQLNDRVINLGDLLNDYSTECTLFQLELYPQILYISDKHDTLTQAYTMHIVGQNNKRGEVKVLLS